MSTIAVQNVKPVLEALRMLEPTLYKTIQKEIVSEGNFVAEEIKFKFPKEPWESRRGVNWTKYGRTQRGRKPEGATGAAFPRYRLSDVRKGVRSKAGGRKRRDGSYPILTIQQRNAAGVIFDLATINRTVGKDSFVRNLNKVGSPSRIMWPTVLRHKKRLDYKINKIVEKVEKQFKLEIRMESMRRQNASIRASRQARNALGQFGRML
jgi:hypothetical protein